MNPSTARFGLPPAETLKKYRIWDSYFTPSHSHPGRDGSSRLIADIERSLPTIEKGQFEKLCYFAHVGVGTTSDAELERTLRSDPKTILKPLKRWPDMLLGMIQLNANDVPASLDALDRWLRDGPMLGVYFPGGGSGAMTCTHRNFNSLVKRITELNGVIMQHTWFKTGGKQGPGESTPTELAELRGGSPIRNSFVLTRAANGNAEFALCVRRLTSSLKPQGSTRQPASSRWPYENLVRSGSSSAVTCLRVRSELNSVRSLAPTYPKPTSI